MRLTAATIVASLAWTACCMTGPARAVDIELGQALSLRPGESAQTADGSLRVGFDGVTSDSRCPKGQQCFWAGDAVVRVWLQQGSGPRQMRELRTPAGRAQAASALNHDVRLVSLDPYPVTGRPSAPQDYVATLVLSRAAPVSSER